MGLDGEKDFSPYAEVIDLFLKYWETDERHVVIKSNLLCKPNRRQHRLARGSTIADINDAVASDSSGTQHQRIVRAL